VTAEEVAERFAAKRIGSGWMACCPLHEDTTPSLSIGKGREGRVLLRCHAGCKRADILGARGLTEKDLFAEGNGNGTGKLGEPVATYDYRDKNGALLFQVVRFAFPKTFRQRRPDGNGGGWIWSLGDVRRVPYRLPELLQRSGDAPVWISEGEKDCNTLAALGLCATTNAGGAGKWRPEYGASLQGADVIIIPDNDDPGRRHATDIATKLQGIAARVRIVTVPKGKDASEYLEMGGTVADLLALAEHAPTWTPTTISTTPTIPDAPTTPPLATLPIVRILEGQAPEPPGMMVDDLVLDGDVNLLAGFGSAYKSLIVLLIAISVALGRNVVGSLKVHRSGRVLLVCPEDGEAIVRMVLDAIILGLGLDATDRATIMDRLVMVPDTKLVNLTTDTGLLAGTAKEHGAVLVVLDPLRNLLGGADENDNGIAGATVDALRRDVCRGAGAAVLINAHARKPGKDNAPDTAPTIHEMRGASAWANGARLVFGASAQGNRVTLRALKANRLRADLRHEWVIEIDADPENKARWRCVTISDANAGAHSEAFTPGIGRDLNTNERTVLGCLNDQHEPNKRLSISTWKSDAGINPNTFKTVKERLLGVGLALAIPTGHKHRNGGTEYGYQITEPGRRALRSGWVNAPSMGEQVSDG